MARTLGARLAFAAAVTLITFVGAATRSVAADPPDQVFDFDPGVACAFGLHVDVWNSPNRVMKEFTDKNGNVVRMINAGKGNQLTFTNVATKKTLSLKPNGSVEHIAIGADGTQTWTVTGHNVLILFPTDVPAGPSTTLYVGRIVFTVNTSGVFTLQRVSGMSTDICAALI